MKCNRKISAAVVALFILTANNSVYAAPLSESKNQLESFKKEYSEIVKEIEASEIEIQKLDSQIEKILLDIDDIGKKIEKSKKSLIDNENDIKAIEKNIKEEEKIFEERIESLYINGSTSYINVLLEAESFNDFVSRVDTLKAIIRYDNEIMKDLKGKKDTLVTKKGTLEKEKSSFLALQGESNKKLEELNSSKSEQDKAVLDLREKKSKYSLEIEKYEREIENAIKEAKKAQEDEIKKAEETKKVQEDGTNTIEDQDEEIKKEDDEKFSSSSGMFIVNYARKYLGVPYTWGGKSPSEGFDCSGFTYYVYKNAVGKTIPSYSLGQADIGKTVSKNELKVGDLVFFGSPTHHVGIYSGNGNYIHAPQTGDVVKEVPMTRDDFTHGKRIL